MSSLTVRRLVNIVTRGVGPLDAQALGYYRVCFAIGVWWILRDLTMVAWEAPGSTQLQNAWFADWEWIEAIANRPDLVARLESLILGGLVLFGIGLWTRSCYLVVVVGLTLWTLVRLQHTGTHNWAVLLVTLWCLVPVRWGDGLSLDRFIARFRDDGSSTVQNDRDYGFAVWMPGFVLGTAMLAAAYAKLSKSGVEWVVGGAVKYHFVTDALSAPVDWGLWVASHHWAAVTFSALGVGTEALLIVAVFLRRGWMRSLLGVAGFGLLVGFYLFQNEVWSAWWMLWACFFIPWSSIHTHITGWVRAWRSQFNQPEPVASSNIEVGLTGAQLSLVILVFGLQLIASVFQIEQQPLLSNYPMYSSTFLSTDAFDETSPMHSPIGFMSITTDGQQDMMAALESSDLDGPLRDQLVALSEGQALTEERRERLRWVADQFYERSGQQLGVVTFMRDARAFDWTIGEVRSSGMLPVVTFDTNLMRVVITDDEAGR